MDLTELPVIGSVVSAAALVGDLVFYGGEVFASLVVFALLSPDNWVTIVMYGQRLASRVPWLPEAPLETAVTIGLLLLVVIGVARFVRDWRETRA